MAKRLLTVLECELYKEEFDELKAAYDAEHDRFFPNRSRIRSLYRKMVKINDILQKDYEESERALKQEGVLCKAS